MKKFTGNYSNTEHNFVIQNLPDKYQVSESDAQLFSVLKNILLRGSPTLLSKFLQKELDIAGYYKKEGTKITSGSRHNPKMFSILKINE